MTDAEVLEAQLIENLQRRDVHPMEEATSGTRNVERLIRKFATEGKIDAFFTCGSRRLTALLQKLGREFDIPGQVALEQQMACGLGISNANDAIEYMLAGASAVQVGTATFVHPTAMTTIIDELAAFCESRRIGSITSLIAQASSKNFDDVALMTAEARV